jgi:hypothetical protein
VSFRRYYRTEEDPEEAHEPDPGARAARLAEDADAAQLPLL